MKIVIPDSLKGKDLYKFLIENKSALIAQKKSIMKRTESTFSSPQFLFERDPNATKAAGDTPTTDVDTGILRVKVAANTCMWFDSQKDVLLPDAGKRSMKERKGMIPHIHDHIWEVTAEVGDVQNIYYQEMPLSDLGLNKAGSASVIVFETDIIKSYNETVYKKYKAGRIKQHSIGLQYVKIELAINDEEYEKEMDFWNKYFNLIINKEEAEAAGYFWVVSEFKLMENSAVLFGSNILTPTLESEEKTVSTAGEPPSGTHEQPHEKTVDLSSTNWDRIADKIFSIN